MVRTDKEMTVVSKSIRGGKGECIMKQLLTGEAELYGKGRMFNRITINPGVEIGYHTHSGDNEVYYFLSGSGLYNDNGTELTVHAGDITICNDGESHGFVNNTDEPVEALALIIYS